MLKSKMFNFWSIFLCVSLKKHSAYSFTGCLKNLQLDGEWLSSMAHSFGVTPCFEGLSETGTYFSEEGGYIILGIFLLIFLMERKRQRLIYNIITTTIFFTNPKCWFCENFLSTVYLTLCTFGRTCSSCKLNICYITWLIRLDKLHHPQRMERVWLGAGTWYPHWVVVKLCVRWQGWESRSWGGGWGHGVPKVTWGLSSSCWTREKRGLLSPTFFSPPDETFDLGLRFELVMNVRPRVASGVLLHVRSAEGYFTMYIHQGEVSPSSSKCSTVFCPDYIKHACCVRGIQIKLWHVFPGGGSCERWV